MSFRMFLVLSLAMLAVGLGDSARADLLINGDFEDAWDYPTEPSPPGWGVVGSNFLTKQTSPVIGGSVSAHLDGTGASGTLTQVPSESPSYWCLDVDFASEDPGSGKRSFYAQLLHPGSDDYIMLKVEGDGSGAGDLFAYSDGYLGSSHGKAWHLVLDDAVSFSSDVASGPLAVNHLQVIGHYNDATPTYDILLTDADSTVHSALGQTIWRTSSPATGDGIIKVKFVTHKAFSNGDCLIDNVQFAQVPEPSTAVMTALALVSLAVLGLRRRK